MPVLPQVAYAVSEQLFAVVPAALCVAACWDLPGASRRALIILLATFACLLVASGVACAALRLPSMTLMLPLCLFAVVALKLLSGLSLGPFAMLVATGGFIETAVSYLAIVVDAFVVGDSLSETYLAWPGMATSWALGVACLLGLWRFFRHRMPELLGSKAAGAQFWRLAWVVPALPCAMFVIFTPLETSTLLVRRVGASAAVAVLSSAVLVALYETLLWRMAHQSAELQLATERLHRAELLATQQRGLERRMAQARAARHDLRHHWQTVAALLEAGDVAGARAYVSDREGDRALVEPLRYCENAAVNAVLGYYLGQAIELGAQVDARVNLPATLPQGDGNAVVVLGNLLENAVLALADVPPAERVIKVRANLLEAGDMLVCVDNACATPVVRAADGSFVSTRHEGPAVGTASVRMTAEALGGEARFECDGPTFRASVLLGVAREGRDG